MLGASWEPDAVSDQSPADDELRRLKHAANTAEEAARWLRSSLRRIRDGNEIELEVHNAFQAISDALATVKGTPESPTAGFAAETDEDGDEDGARPKSAP
jgi:hypothetical protein